MSAGFQLQVRGEWAGTVFNTWRPAVDGTLNQSELAPEEASTFDTIDDARAFLDSVVLPGLPDEDPRDAAPKFRVVDLATGDAETR